MSDDLARLGRAYRRAKARAEALHQELKDAVVQAYQDGAGTMDIARRTEQDRELVRRILKDARDRGLLPPLHAVKAD